MTKLTTEITIEELQYRIHAHENDLTQMWTADYFLNVQKELLASKQSAKNSADLKTLVISEIVDFYAGFESPGEPETVDEAQSQLIERIEKVFGLAAPVLPKQPELVENLKKVMNNWLAMEPKLAFQPEFTDVMMLLDAESAPTQPVIPEQRQRISDDDLVAVPRSVLACAGYAYGKAGLKDSNAYTQLRSYFFAPAITAQPVQEMTYMMATERGIKTSNREQWIKGYNAAINDSMLLSPAQPVNEPYKLPDGYCIMPKRLTAENGAKYALSGEFSTPRVVVCPECDGDGCSDCDGRGDYEEDQLIEWTTIKNIYSAAVSACALHSSAGFVSKQILMDEKLSRELFEKRCTANIERNKWHPEHYAHPPAREQWKVWEACRDEMLSLVSISTRQPTPEMPCVPDI